MVKLHLKHARALVIASFLAVPGDRDVGSGWPQAQAVIMQNAQDEHCSRKRLARCDLHDVASADLVEAHLE